MSYWTKCSKALSAMLLCCGTKRIFGRCAGELLGIFSYASSTASALGPQTVVIIPFGKETISRATANFGWIVPLATSAMTATGVSGRFSPAAEPFPPAAGSVAPDHTPLPSGAASDTSAPETAVARTGRTDTTPPGSPRTTCTAIDLGSPSAAVP